MTATQPAPGGLASWRRRSYYRLFGADAALRALVPARARVLDVGCSDGRGSEVLTGAFGCDVHRPTLRLARDSERRRHVVQADVRRLPYRARSFDLVTALDVVEHFEKADALAVIAELERVSADLVVVMTPSGFVPQPPTEDEPWQEHRCGFEADELAALGYDVRGVGGSGRARGSYGSFRGGPFGQLLAVASSPWTRARPDRAFHLLGVKHVRD